MEILTKDFINFINNRKNPNFKSSPSKKEKKEIAKFYKHNSKKKKKKSNRSNYRKYIKSKKWELRRKRFFASNKRECSACFEINNLIIHHLSYKSLGNEPDSDLIILCENCHKEYHELNGVKTEMYFLTHSFIEEKHREAHLKSIIRG